MKVADVAVVGAGPGGAAAALTLARLGCRVVLIDDAGKADGWTVGELLSGQARAALDFLDMTAWVECEGSIAVTAIASAWGSEDVDVNPSILNPYGGGWFLDRGAFERALVDRAEARGAEIWRRTRARTLERHEGGFFLAGRADGHIVRTSVRFVIDATGRSCWAARHCAHDVAIERFDQQVAVAARLRAEVPLSAALLLESCEEGWWYSVPTPAGAGVAAFVTDADWLRAGETSGSAWHRALALSSHTRERLEGCTAEAVQVQPSGTSRLPNPAGPGWAAIGDAAMALDPLSSQGMAKALRNGVDVAHSLAKVGASPFLTLSEYRESCATEFAEYLAVLRWFYGREQRWQSAPFWQRRQDAATSLAAAGPA